MKAIENVVREEYEKAGYTVYRNGWPDFLVVKDGVGFGVEVKSATENGSGGEKLSDAQIDMQTALHKLGVSTTIRYVVRSEYQKENPVNKEIRLIEESRQRKRDGKPYRIYKRFTRNTLTSGSNIANIQIGATTKRDELVAVAAANVDSAI